MTVEPKALTVNELMRRWDCTRQTILRAIKEGRLKAFRVGARVFRVTLDEVVRFESATREPDLEVAIKRAIGGAR